MTAEEVRRRLDAAKEVARLWADRGIDFENLCMPLSLAEALDELSAAHGGRTRVKGWDEE